MLQVYETPRAYQNQAYITYYLCKIPPGRPSASYKLRINVAEENFTRQSKEIISDSIIRLNRRYSTDDFLLIEQFKYAIADRLGIESSYEYITMNFWECLGRGDKEGANIWLDRIAAGSRKLEYKNYLAGNIQDPEFTEIMAQKIQSRKILIQSKQRGIGKFTLYIAALDYTSDTNAKTQLIGFLKELENQLRKFSIQPGIVDETDFSISPYISLRFDKAASGAYVSHSEREKINSLKLENKESPILLQFRENMQKAVVTQTQTRSSAIFFRQTKRKATNLVIAAALMITGINCALIVFGNKSKVTSDTEKSSDALSTFQNIVLSGVIAAGMCINILSAKTGVKSKLRSSLKS